MADGKKERRNKEIALIAGLVLVVLGTYEFFKRVVPQLWPEVSSVISGYLSFIWTLIAIVAAIYLLVAMRKGKVISSSGKPLMRSSSNRKIAGVCGGLAEFFDIDPLIVRIVSIVLLVPGFFVVLAVYILLWIALPEETATTGSETGFGAGKT